MDEIFWDNTAGEYPLKRSAAEREQLLSTLLKHDHWDIEGVCFEWLAESFAQADLTVILQPPARIFNTCIIKRFIRRKIGLEKAKAGNLRSTIKMMKWANRYQKRNLPEIMKLLEPYMEKVIKIENPSELFSLLEKWNKK